MKLLEDRILKDGKVKGTEILRVDSFLNHQMDISLFTEMGKEFDKLFQGEGVNKVLTIEASGIGIAAITAQVLGVPVVFAKKSPSKNLPADVYSTQVQSFTHGRIYDVLVSKQFLTKDDRILIIDDFLANGAALDGLISIVNNSGAHLCGVGIVVEKAFQPGGSRLRESGIRIESLARIASMSEEGGVIFADN
ncbi:MAG: xanthine phosphoribosyltransferase [Eubacteriales bacterium]